MFDFKSGRSAGGASRLSKATMLGLVVLLMTAVAGCGEDDPSNPSGGGGTGGTGAAGSGGTGAGGSGGTGEAGSGGSGGVEVHVARVEVTPDSLSIVEHGTAEFHAIAYAADDEFLSDVVVEWTSSDPSIATVDADGNVKALQPGLVTILATVGDKSGGADLTVTEATIESVTLGSDSITVAVDGTVSLELKLLDGEGNELLGRSVPWVSADTSIATVDQRGVVKGVSPGAVSLSATVAGHTVEVDATVVLRFVDMTVGEYHTCALTAQGGAWCWGDNRYGQLGTGEMADPEDDDFVQLSIHAFPVKVGSDQDLRFQMIRAGEAFTCGLSLDGKTWCWGDNDSYVLGRGHEDVDYTPTPTLLEGLEYVAISSMAYGACGLDSEGFASCWGYNSGDYELGDPDNTDDSAEPLLVSAPVGEEPLRFSVLRHGRYHSCGLTASSRLYCWGYNSSGRIGDGTTLSVARPIEPLPGEIVRAFGLGGSHTCAVTAANITYCWGANHDERAEGEDHYLLPTERFDTATFVPVDFALGDSHSCALNAAGVAWCWGDNWYGQLGRQNDTSAAPAVVAGGLRFHQLASRDDHTCGRAYDEKLYCWGSKWNRVAEEDPEPDFEPVLVPGQ